jgi:hypothetical protein
MREAYPVAIMSLLLMSLAYGIYSILRWMFS